MAPTDDVRCTYCGTELAQLQDVESGDELTCEDCEVTYDLVFDDEAGFMRMLPDHDALRPDLEVS